MRRIAILAEGAFEWHYGKTGICVIHYGKDLVVAINDITKAGQDVSQSLGASFGQGIPIVRGARVSVCMSSIVRKLLKRGNFSSLDELCDQNLAYMAYYNRTVAKPIKWT